MGSKQMKMESRHLDNRQLHRLLGSAIAPRPVALISTVGADGIYNAAPYSALTLVAYKPPVVCISSGLRQGQMKDTAKNITSSNDFVMNIMAETHLEQVLKAAADLPGNVDEIELTGLTAMPADAVASPLISEAQVSLECRVVRTLEFGDGDDLRTLFFGEVLLFHVKDAILTGTAIDPRRMAAVGRMNAGFYCRTTEPVRQD